MTPKERDDFNALFVMFFNEQQKLGETDVEAAARNAENKAASELFTRDPINVNGKWYLTPRDVKANPSWDIEQWARASLGVDGYFNDPRPNMAFDVERQSYVPSFDGGMVDSFLEIVPTGKPAELTRISTARLIKPADPAFGQLKEFLYQNEDPEDFMTHPELRWAEGMGTIAEYDSLHSYRPISMRIVTAAERDWALIGRGQPVFQEDGQTMTPAFAAYVKSLGIRLGWREQ